MRGLSSWQQYLLSLLLTAAALLISLALEPVIRLAPGIVLILGVMLSAWLGGLGPSILAAGLSTVALRFFFFRPVNSLIPLSASDAIALGVFALGALLMSAVSAQLQLAYASVKSSAERAEKLQIVTAALSQAVTPEQVAQVIMHEGLAALRARTISLVVLSDDGQWLVNVAHIGYPPQVLPQLQRYPVSSHLSAGDVARTGQPVWLENREAIQARYPERDDLLSAIGHHAVAAVPLNLESRLLGVLVITFTERLAFTPDVRRYIITLAGNCAQALGRARLYEREQQARQRAQRLTAVAAALSRALTPPEVTEVILHEGAEALEAGAASLVLLSDDGQWLENAAAIGYPPKIIERFRRSPISSAIPAADAARSGQPVWLASAEEYRARYPQLTDAITRVGHEAEAALPLLYEGRPLGTLVFSFRRVLDFDDDIRQYMVALASYCAQALERSRLYEAQQQARHAAEEAGERQARLKDIMAALSRSMTREQAARAFVVQGLAVLGARTGVVAALVTGGDEMVCLALEGYSADVREQWARFPLTAPVPLAEAARTGQPVFIGSGAELAERYPELQRGAEQIGSAALAVLPLSVDGRTIGVLGLSFASPQTFGPEWRALALGLAQECAQALDRARAYTELEQAVQQHSQALEVANASLRQEITEREQAQAQLSVSYEQVRALAADLQVAREEERQRLAREIHDELGGSLTGLKMDVARVQRELGDRADLAELLKAIDLMVQEVRSIATELRPALLDDFGLLAAIESLAQDFKTRVGIGCCFSTDLETLELSPEASIGVYRVVQESLTNVARHAHAKSVHISLAQEPDCLVLRVADDGQGFVMSSVAQRLSLGLTGMRERVRAFSGELDIQSAPGQGTTVSLRIPRPTAN